MYHIVTKWFGVFIYNDKGVVKHLLFPKDEDELVKRLVSIKKGEVLDEEKELIKEFKDVFASDVRLANIATLIHEKKVFKDVVELKPEDYGFTLDLLNRVSSRVAEMEIKEKLEKKDLQIIQMIKSFDELKGFLNILSERLEEWKSLPSPDESINMIVQLRDEIKKTVESLEESIKEKMQEVAPNLSAVAGPLLGACLIMLAGALERLALLPSSTIQIIGAEKALFRYKHGEGTPPKHGVIFQHHLMRRVKPSQRGKVARLVAAKCATAAKADAFTKRDLTEFLKEEISSRLKEIKNV
ncbi:MAG: hypothetical protein DRN01_00270 [Thermoplasmata archaeon]|nr:MAG: hypothetical protein DRN01_00270 [Thermoplasmata archaeon]